MSDERMSEFPALQRTVSVRAWEQQRCRLTEVTFGKQGEEADNLANNREKKQRTKFEK